MNNSRCSDLCTARAPDRRIGRWGCTDLGTHHCLLHRRWTPRALGCRDASAATGHVPDCGEYKAAQTWRGTVPGLADRYGVPAADGDTHLADDGRRARIRSSPASRPIARSSQSGCRSRSSGASNIMLSVPSVAAAHTVERERLRFSGFNHVAAIRYGIRHWRPSLCCRRDQRRAIHPFIAL